MDSNSYTRPKLGKRFVIEDSITKVTSDGEPHEMMTMIAGLSGLLAAIVILAILVSLVACQKKKQVHDPCQRCSNENIADIPFHKRALSLSSLGGGAAAARKYVMETNACRLISIATISGNNLPGILDSKLITNDLKSQLSNDNSKKSVSVADSHVLRREKKLPRWSDDVEAQQQHLQHLVNIKQKY